MAGKWRRARVAASSGILLAGVWGSAMALFTDTAASGTGTFTTGDIDIAASDASTTLALTGMAPGDMVTGPITVSNNGSLDLRYAMTAAGAGDAALRAGLAVEVKQGVADCSNGGFGASGTSIASGDLDSVAFGDPAAGAHTGDRVLAPGASEDLCFQVRLPITADSTLQNLSASTTFTFAAEQTRNN